MDIKKHKLPKGFTYPLKSSLVESTLKKVGIELPVTLYYESDAELLVATYYFPRTWEDYEKIVLFSGSVSSRNSEEARQHLENNVLPEFTSWISGFHNLPENSSVYTGDTCVQWVSPSISYTKKGGD